MKNSILGMCIFFDDTAKNFAEQYDYYYNDIEAINAFSCIKEVYSKIK